MRLFPLCGCIETAPSIKMTPPAPWLLYSKAWILVGAVANQHGWLCWCPLIRQVIIYMFSIQYTSSNCSIQLRRRTGLGYSLSPHTMPWSCEQLISSSNRLGLPGKEALLIGAQCPCSVLTCTAAARLCHEMHPCTPNPRTVGVGKGQIPLQRLASRPTSAAATCPITH